MREFRGRELKKIIAVLLLSGSFLFFGSIKSTGASSASYSKAVNGTLQALDWNNLATDFANTWGTSTLAGPVGIGTANPEYALHISGGDSLGVQLGVGSSLAWGEPIFKFVPATTNYLSLGFSNGSSAPSNVAEALTIQRTGNVGIGKSNPGANLDIIGSLNTSGTVNGLGLCISGDCKVSWASIVSSGGGNLWSGTTTGSIYNGNMPNNVGIGTSTPAVRFQVYGNGTNSAAFTNGNVGIGTTNPGNLLTTALGSGVSNTIPALGANGGSFGMFADAGKYGLIQGVLGNGNVFMQAQRVDATATAYNMLLQPNGGNVGIGTTSPSTKLHIYAGSSGGTPYANTTITLETNSRSIFQFLSPSTTDLQGFYFGNEISNTAGQLTYNPSTGLFQWYKGSTRFVIDTNGNVGIGITNPKGPLHVYASSTDALVVATNGFVGFGKTNPGQNVDVIGGITTTGTVNGLGLCISGDCRVSWASIVSAGGGNLWSGTTTGSIYNANGANNVGIGTTNPLAKLQVQGPTAVSNDWNGYSGTYAGTSGDADPNNYMPELVIARTLSGATNPTYLGGLSFTGHANGSSGAGIYGVDPNPAGSTGYGELHFWTTSWNGSALQAVDNMVIRNSGNVGIGTTTPGNLLHVYSNVSVTAPLLKIEQDNATGYAIAALDRANVYRVSATTYSTGGVSDWYTGELYNGGVLNSSFSIATSSLVSSSILSVVSTGNVGIMKTNPGTNLDVVGGINASGTVNGSGLCISGDCRVNWGAVGSSLGWTRVSPYVYLSTSTDSVGIGTVAPVTKLALSSATTTFETITDTANVTGPVGGILFSSQNESTYRKGAVSFVRTESIANRGYLSFALDPNATNSNVDADIIGNTKMAINYLGNVGIGTTNPTLRFTVPGDASTAGLPASSGSTPVGIASFGGGNNTNALYFGALNSGTYAVWLQASNPTNFATSYPLFLNPNGGNVGIGTTNPTQKLSVNVGTDLNFRFRSNSGVTELYTANDADGVYTKFRIQGVPLLLNPDSGGNVGIGLANPAGTFQVSNASSTSALFVNTATSSTGAYVGIFKSNPAQNLDVVGGINASGTVNGSGLCISGDCRVNWGAVGSSLGWTRVSPYVYLSTSTDFVGIGVTNPITPLQVVSPSALTPALFQTTINNYGEINMQNLSAGNNASSDITATANNGTATSYYVNLGINSSAYNQATFNITGANDAYLFSSDSPLDIGTATTSAASVIKFFTGGTVLANERMRITPTGNVGIGTTGPAGLLDIFSTDSTKEVYLTGNYSGTNQNSNSPRLNFVGQSQTAGFGIQAVNTASYGRKDLVFYAHSALDYTTYSEAMRIQYTGNVGIGTTTPAGTFQVANASSTSALFVNSASGNTGGYVGIFKTNPAQNLDIVGGMNASGSVNGTSLCIAGDCKVSWASIVSSGGGNLWAGTTTGAIWNGNGVNYVGIGLTNPGVTLDVSTDSGVIFRRNASQSQYINFFSDANGNSIKFNGVTGKTTSILNNPQATDAAGTDLILGAGSNVAGTASPDLSGGTLYLKSGAGTGAGASMINFQTGTTLGSGLTLQTLSTKMTILGNGNVGVGTINPLTKFQISTPTNANAMTLGSATGVAFSIKKAEEGYGLHFGIAGSGTSWIQSGSTAGATAYDLSLQASGGNILFPGSGIWNSSGNVGVGTTTPANKFQVYGNGTVAASFTNGNVGIGITNPAGIFDVYTAASSTHALFIANSGSNVGYVGINQPAPSVRLQVTGGGIDANGSVNGTLLCIAGDCRASWASTTAAYLPLAGGTMTGTITMTNNGSNNINMGGGTSNIYNLNKLTVGTIDPLYTIHGSNYATFASSISGGVKEEYVGQAEVNKKVSSKEYESVLDFDNVSEGTDLWVWRQVVDFNKDNIEVFITPYGQFANVYYSIENNKLIFRSDRPTEISYRLTGRRFDWRNWPTKTLNQEEKGIIVN